VHLNHLDLQAHDIQALATFFVDHLGFTRISNDRSPAICILAGADGFSLVLQRRSDDAPYPAGFHIGFVHLTPDEVRAHHARLTSEGVAVGPVDVNARGTRFYLRAPEEILIEVSSSTR
jgi:catechol 2,3-dioxygenase-like lactoylglutathione lyase family enzyme